MFLAPQFGASPNKATQERMEESSHYRDGTFNNLVQTELNTREPGESLGLQTFLFPEDDKNPSAPLPSKRFSAADFKSGDFVWFGHSTVLFRTGELNILADPVFNRASPIPVGGKAFDMIETATVADLPDIDVVIISHDHYDHLDHKAIGALATQVTHFLVPLGNQAHLEHWGVPASKIIELDWYEDHAIAGTQFTLTPTRHFSGRGITNRNSTLWGSWVVQNTDASIYFSGDSGYFDEFKTIGDKFGPFDIAFIENGAYDKGWSQIHMTPEQSVQSALDLRAKLFFPIHWGKFDLAKHKWVDPIERAVLAAEQNELPLVAPLIGEIFSTNQPPFTAWWK